MTNPKVSILIPVYNVSNYIEHCAHSLFKQTFQDLEYIFVNDCTPDDSIEKLQNIIKQYPLVEQKVKIIQHDSNKGISAARNAAIEASKGDFISFVDSDDYIEPNMIEVLYNKALAEQADIIVSDFFSEYPDKTIYVQDIINVENDINFKELITQNHTYACFWNKLISRDLYKRPECKIPEGLNYGEDLYVMTRIYYLAKKIAKVDQALYHYVQYNSNAITKSKKRMHFENLVLFWETFEHFLKEHNEYEKYSQIIELPKVQGKVRLMIDTNSYKLRKEFRNIFAKEEKKHLSEFKKGEWLILILLQRKLYCLAHIFHFTLVIKNKFKT